MKKLAVLLMALTLGGESPADRRAAWCSGVAVTA